MSKHLIRFARRRLTVWRPERTAREVQELEFRDQNGLPDTRPSVFEIELEDLVQAYAEYSTLLAWTQSTFGINVEGIATRLKQSPAGTLFNLTESAHREIILDNEGELLAVIDQIRQDFQNRKHDVQKAEVEKYARDRLAAADPEWVAAVERARGPKPNSWVAKLIPSMSA